MKKSIGLDIGKKEIEASIFDGKKYRNHTYKNTKSGLNRMVKDFNKEEKGVVIMEATGTYHLKCAYRLYENGFDVKVENPLVIKRFGQLQLRRSKTDKADARLIALFGYREDSRVFKPIDADKMKMRVLVKEIDQIHKDINRNISRIDALKQYPEKMTETIKRYEKKNRIMKKEIKKIQEQINEIINKDKQYKETQKRMKTIKGVGDRLSSAIIAYMGSYEDFETARQVASYVGITPTISQSGTSVNSRGGISKMGNKYIRCLLRNCGLTAIRHNKQCITLKERLELKGKKHNEILIAAGHKLIRQTYGVVKNKKDYDPNYVRNV